MAETIRTPLTELFGIKYPVYLQRQQRYLQFQVRPFVFLKILLAGMNVAAGPKLAAAVTNAGGLGVIGILHLHLHLRSLSPLLYE